MNRECPNTECLKLKESVKKGSYRRKSDSKVIPRFFCPSCKKTFSTATFSNAFGQHKRRLNPLVYKLLCSGVSQRRIAILLTCNLKTVARKLIYLARTKSFTSEIDMNQITEVQFDEMEAWDHPKLRPVSILLFVEKHSRKILEIKVSRMSAKGLLKEKSIKKYGKIKDQRYLTFKDSFKNLTKMLPEKIIFESDQAPRYPHWVKTYFPHSNHITYKGRSGCVVGQGELKSGGYDPLFSLNHTCAMFRANVNRLFRRTWCTTKKLDRLQMHLNLYGHFHNTQLL